MDELNNIFLVGPMGSGKTTIGRQLAKVLEREFVDSDHEISRRTGADIPWIFDIEGEAGFRERERAVIDDLTQRQGIVLATGGGAVLDASNRHYLASRGTTVYLSASIDQLHMRTAKDRNRPLLQTDDPRAQIEALMEIRDPLYREVADIVVDTDDRSVRATVQYVIDEISQQTSSEM